MRIYLPGRENIPVAACFPPANSIQRTIDRACSHANDPFDPVIGPLDRVVSLHSKLLTCAAYRDYPFTRDRMSYNLRFVSVMFGIEELRELEPVPTKAY